jgi:hypothetical protein
MLNTPFSPPVHRGSTKITFNCLITWCRAKGARRSHALNCQLFTSLITEAITQPTAPL